MLPKTIKCNACGGIMELISEGVWVCNDCDNKAYADANDPTEISQMYDEWDYEDVYGSGKPTFCEVCDCDAYPICREGCKMFDD